jgi:UDP-N-acetylmuramyl pentapeptide synthase
MTLGEILSGAGLVQPLTPDLAQSQITGLEYDSRRVSSGALFFAFPGA